MINFRKNFNRLVGFEIHPAFSIKLHKDDELLLKYLHQTYQLGNVNEYRQFATWSITSLEECEQLIELLDDAIETLEQCPFKASSKMLSYEKWCECVQLISTGEHTTVNGAARIARIRGHMNRDARGRPTEQLLKIIRLADKRMKGDSDTN